MKVPGPLILRKNYVSDAVPQACPLPPYEQGYKKQKEGAKVDKRKPLIEQLTTVFTRAQLVALIQQNGLDTEARFFISQWKSNGWIIKLRKNVYQKQV